MTCYSYVDLTFPPGCLLLGFSFDSSLLHLSRQPPSAAAPWELEGFIKRGGAGAEGGGGSGEGGGGGRVGEEGGEGGGGEMERSAGAVVGPLGWRFRQSPDPLHKLQDNDNDNVQDNNERCLVPQLS